MDAGVRGSSARPASPRKRLGRSTILLVVLGAALICILTWTLVVRQIAFEREEALRNAIAHNDDRSLMLRHYVSRLFETADFAALHVAELYARDALASGTASRPRLIGNPIAQDDVFLGLSVVNEAGDLVATTLEGPGRTPNVSAHPAFAVHRTGDTGRLFVGRPSYSQLLESDTILLSRRLNHADGSFAGVVAINLKPSQLTAIFGETAVKPSESAWVVGLDGIIRARMTGGVVTSGENVSHGEVFRLQRRMQRGHFLGRGTIDGRMRLVSHRRVPGFPLFVSYSVLLDEVLRGPRQRAALFLVGAGLVTLITMLLAAVIIQALRERERRASDLAEAKERLEEAQRIARVGDWSNTFDGALVWSPQLYEMYERDPALGPMRDELLALLPESSVRILRESVARLIERGQPESWEIEVRLPSGRTRHHLVSAVPTVDRHGKIVGFHGTTQDVTEARMLQALQDDLAHLSRTGAMNAMAATLAHELNQPLTAATNYLGAGQIVASRLPEEARGGIVGPMAEAQRQVLRAGEIIRRMRNLVSKGLSERSVTSIADVLAEALEMVRVMKLCRHPPEVHLSDGDLRFEGDSVQIQQVILNLVRNACEAQDGIEAPPPRIEIDSDLGGRINVSVVDHGPGFPEAQRARFFEPFTSSKQSGLGLGLSISRTIVEAHGGSLTARNNPSGGATVSFTLPRYGES